MFGAVVPMEHELLLLDDRTALDALPAPQVREWVSESVRVCVRGQRG